MVDMSARLQRHLDGRSGQRRAQKAGSRRSEETEAETEQGKAEQEQMRQPGIIM